MTLNKEELATGFVFGICFWPIIGPLTLLVGTICSFLWALTGSGKSKLYRRLGVPLVPCAAIYLMTYNWHIWISLPLAYGVLSLGYGIPSTQPPDSGSTLGRFWYRVFNNNETKAHLATRGTIYLLLLVSFLVGLFI